MVLPPRRSDVFFCPCVRSGEGTFQVKIRPLDAKEHVRIHVPPPLDRGDGSFLVRYRLYGTALKGLRLEVLHRDAAVAKSPYSIRGGCLVFQRSPTALCSGRPLASVSCVPIWSTRVRCR